MRALPARRLRKGEMPKGWALGIYGETDVQQGSRCCSFRPIPVFSGAQAHCRHNRSPGQIVERLDRLIGEIRTKYHADAIGRPKTQDHMHCDVLIVAHGHILRAFAMRWIGRPLTSTAFILEPGGVGTLR